jgi:hypothetical protein
MTSDFFRELRKLSTAWHDEISLLRDMARQAPTLIEEHNLTVMANTYLVCASALDEIVGEDKEAEAGAVETPRARAQHA